MYKENQAQVLGQALAQKLRWLTARVFVLGSATGGCPEGLVVTDLQGDGATMRGNPPLRKNTLDGDAGTGIINCWLLLPSVGTV